MGVLRNFRVPNCGRLFFARDLDVPGLGRAGLERLVRKDTYRVNRVDSGSGNKSDLVVYTCFWGQKDIKTASWPTALNISASDVLAYLLIHQFCPR